MDPTQPSIYKQTDLTYNGYLKVPELLSLQHILSSPPHHDELLFIIIHQTYELWFRQILHEMESAQASLEKDSVGAAHHQLVRIVAIMRVLVQQIHILETMKPQDFLKFRDRLNPASGFQSLQFRELEFLAGARDERYLEHFKNFPEILEKLKGRLAQRSLWTSYSEMVERVCKQDLRPALLQLYQSSQNSSDDAKSLPLYLLTEAMLEIDQQLGLWREHHVRVVERIIGHKVGTGGSSGVGYLKTTTSKKCFPLLWEIRTEIQ